MTPAQGPLSGLPVIGGYRLVQPWEASGSANWSFAERDGRLWFIKEFGSPCYLREEDGFSPQKIRRRREKCEAFRVKKASFYDRVVRADTGNLVPVKSFFSFGTKFYAVSEKVDTAGIGTGEIAGMESAEKLILLKVLCYSLMRLHALGVVHADLKPDNVLVKRTERAVTMKLIDFDAGFCEEDPPRGKDVSLDLLFMSPEVMLACQDESVTLDRKTDVFSLGLLFHLYWSGELPGLQEDCLYPYEAALRDLPLRMSARLPSYLSALIGRMLRKDPRSRPDLEEVFQKLSRGVAFGPPRIPGGKP